MKHLSGNSWLISALVLLGGCGGRGISVPPQPPTLNIAGNWQFSATSTVSGMPAVTIAGSINQSGVSVSGAVHLDGSNCFDHLTTVNLTGVLTGSNISLTSISVDGQVITFTASIADNALIGTYTINGGCANGDQGAIQGIRMPSITSTFNGTFTTTGEEAFDGVASVIQGSASSLGAFGLTGTVAFQSPCFSSGTIKPGTFPSGSFIIGATVALQIETSNGTVTFLGTANQTTGEISGDYTVLGGTCDQTGIAVLVNASGPWDY
jgi:hypothetical protein